MTTNVVDQAAKVTASDSRWSSIVKDPLGAHHALIYVDDTDFDKIEYSADYSMVFAGSALIIEMWKMWFRNSRDHKKRPPVINDFALCMLDMKTAAVEFDHGQKITGSDHRFAGTGAYYAYTCWNQNKDAARSVKTAFASDFLSGGQVKTLDMQTHKHNLKQSTDHKTINQSILQRGLVMFAKGKTVSVNDPSVQKDVFVQQRLNDIAKGHVSAEAPSGNDTLVWTDADVQRLDAALEKAFGNK